MCWYSTHMSQSLACRLRWELVGGAIIQASLPSEIRFPSRSETAAALNRVQCQKRSRIFRFQTHKAGYPNSFAPCTAAPSTTGVT